MWFIQIIHLHLEHCRRAFCRVQNCFQDETWKFGDFVRYDKTRPLAWCLIMSIWLRNIEVHLLISANQFTIKWTHALVINITVAPYDTCLIGPRRNNFESGVKQSIWLSRYYTGDHLYDLFHHKMHNNTSFMSGMTSQYFSRKFCNHSYFWYITNL